jgi:NAD-dependent DNA ligase
MNTKTIKKNNLKSKNKTKKTRLKTDIDFIIMESDSNSRWNEKFIDLLEQLHSIMLKKGEIFRAKAYQKAQETILTYPNDIVSPDQLKGLPGIGPTIMDKLNEYINTGTLTVIEKEKNNPVNILTEIHGIGPKKADELINAGINNIEDLIQNQDKLLNETQKIGLKYYNDIQKRIPRSEIEIYKDLFIKVFEEIKNNNNNSEAKLEIVGSYRRGAQESGDIDIIITSDSIHIYNQFIDLLINNHIILEVLSRGTNKCLVITKLNPELPARRVDFLFTTKQEFPFAILYFTGSKIFNTVMRHKALKMGYTFNEHGMYKLDDKNKKGEKVSHIFTNEKDIFDFLNLQYKEPWERIDGRYIQEINANIISEPVVIPIPTEKNKIKNKTIKKKNILKDIQENIQENIQKEINLHEVCELFKKMGISVLENLNEKELSDLLEYANNTYYNELPILTDNQYDIIKEYIQTKYPTNKSILEIGAPIPIERNKVTLPYEMASMDKIKPDTGALESWTSKYSGPYVLSCKLDGVSGLYSTEGPEAKLYTRGDGKVGQDISHFIPYFNLPKTKNITIRGEFLISKEEFDKNLKDKFSNPRNLVAGIINQKKVDPNIKYVKFVAYELIKPELIPSEQMIYLQKLPINTVLYKQVNDDQMTNEVLSECLQNWRKNYLYEIDGIIVTDDHIFPRKSGNPEHAFAFKMVLSDQIAEAKVVDVLWTPSKDGYLKPRVRIEPVKLGGVTIEYATGNNAAFIESNKIGIGAIIQIIRSGDVIPKIIVITSPAEEAKMPTVSYQWNNTHIDILLDEDQIQNDPTVKEKNITGFFKGIEVDGLSSGNVARIINAGYDTIPKIIHMTQEDFLKVEGFQHKLADKIYNGIQEKLTNSNLSSIMAYSNIFGRGMSTKKIELIMKEIPDILTSNENKEVKMKKVSEIKGMASKSAESFVEKIDDFLLFLNEIGLQYKLNTEKQQENLEEMVNSNSLLFDKNIVLTGSRDKNILDFLKKVGANNGSVVNKNTFLVIAKDKDEDTGKIIQANKLNIPILSIDEFHNEFMN